LIFQNAPLLSDKLVLESLEIVKIFISHCQAFEIAPQAQESEDSQDYGWSEMDDVAAETDRVMAGKVCLQLGSSFGII